MPPSIASRVNHGSRPGNISCSTAAVRSKTTDSCNMPSAANQSSPPLRTSRSSWPEAASDECQQTQSKQSRPAERDSRTHYTSPVERPTFDVKGSTLTFEDLRLAAEKHGFKIGMPQSAKVNGTYIHSDSNSLGRILTQGSNILQRRFQTTRCILPSAGGSTCTRRCTCLFSFCRRA